MTVPVYGKVAAKFISDFDLVNQLGKVNCLVRLGPERIAWLGQG